MLELEIFKKQNIQFLIWGKCHDKGLEKEFGLDHTNTSTTPHHLYTSTSPSLQVSLLAAPSAQAHFFLWTLPSTRKLKLLCLSISVCLCFCVSDSLSHIHILALGI